MSGNRISHLLFALFGATILAAVLMFSSSVLPLSADADDPMGQAVGDELEIYSSWTEGGEGEGLNALIDLYKSDFPEVTTVTVLSDHNDFTDRMHAGSPPDSFQTHTGAELFSTWVEPGYVEPITQLWADEGWLDEFPQDLIDMLSYRGDIYSVPLNAHRGNVLWYNSQILATNSLTPPTTFDEFFAVADVLQTVGITAPLALGDSGHWAATHLAESVVLGSMGPQEYRGLWNGSTNFDGPEVNAALETFAQMLDYVNLDHGSLTWAEALQRVVDGDAAMTIMGDWTAGYLEAIGLTPGVEVGWTPSPESTGSFMVISDGFALPHDASHRDNAIDWLKTLASGEGQDAFNPHKGSIPARADVISPTLYGDYQQDAMVDYAEDELTPSFAHGQAAPRSFVMASHNIISDFVASGDVEATMNAWQQAACEAGFGECFTPITPGEPSTLVYTDTRGWTTTIQVPTGAVTETTMLGYVPVETVMAPSGFAFAGHAFDLDAYQGGALLPGFTFSVPVTITINYDRSDLGGLDEGTLVLQYWSDDASEWEDAASTCTPTSTYERRPNENWLAVPVCHLSRFAVFGKHKVYLPLVLRNY
jgi:glucose/mannose transport system substrate-binding protein